MSAIFDAANSYYDLSLSNPFQKLRLNVVSSSNRLPFDITHLKLFQAWLNERQRDDMPTGQILILLMYTGARPLDIGGLDSTDLLLDEKVPSLRIRPNAHRRLKTNASQRLVPLVGRALTVARELSKKGSNGALFPKTCHQTGALSARLNQALRSTGVEKSPSLTAYSFRHSIQEALRLSDAPYDVQQAVLGHARTL